MFRFALTMPAVAALALAAGPIDARQEAATAIEDAESYAVYATLIPREWPVTVARAKRLVVQRETGTYNRCLPSGGAMNTDWRPVLDSFKAENARVRLLLADHDLHYPCTVVRKSDIMALLKETAHKPRSGWREFYKRYPDSGGFMEFSAVGFDADKRRALVYIAHYCGPLCGGGMHHLLEKVDGVWRPARLTDFESCFWVS